MDKWLEIDLKKLRHNARSLQEFFPVPVMAVLKHNAYGLGLRKIGPFLEEQGLRNFAVTHLSEGIELRHAGVRSPVMVFAPPRGDEEGLRQLWEYELIPSVYSFDLAEELNHIALELDKPLDVHVKTDTGMGRMGFSPPELLQAAEELKRMEGLNYKGIFTHYSNAFEAKMDYTKKQLDIFLQLTDQLEKKGLSFPVKYSANSMAALKFPSTHPDMVNIGSAFLGNSVINPAVPLEKVYRCRARVLQVRTLQKGSYVGYSNTYKTRADTKIAVLPVGYVDGFGLQKKIDSFRFVDFIRQFYHLIKDFTRPTAAVFHNGRPLKIIGKTSMQLTVVDTGGLDLRPGDIVDLDLSPLLVDARMERVYINEEA